MTTPISPPPAPTVPVYPALGSPSFNEDAYAYGSAMPGVSAALGDLAENVAINAQIGHDNSVTAAQAAQLAQDARDAASGAANFKGLWSMLGGPLNKPASVKHNNRIWLLLNNLADVSASEPGVSADWTSGDSGELLQIVNANTTVQAGPVYVAETAGVTLTLPAGLQPGDVIHIRNATAASIYVNCGAYTVKYKTPNNPLAVPALRSLSVLFTGSTLA